MRLIDGDVLYDSFGTSDRDIYAKEFVLETPTVDAAPVVHGGWSYYQKRFPTFYDEFPDDCGECGWICTHCMEFANKHLSLDYIYTEYDDKPKLPYCPNCGAKMDLMEK